MRVAMLIVGLLMLATGLAAGLVPSSATIAIAATATSPARGDTYSCGSPWNPDQQSIATAQQASTLAANVSTVQGTPVVSESAADLCATALGSRGVWGAMMAALGALTIIGIGLVLAAVRRGPASPQGAVEPPAA
jgi:hypothetical protein